MAVECKDYSRPLSPNDVRDIWIDYEVLVESQDIDEVLIVTAQGFTPSALAYVNKRRGLVAQDIDTLLSSAIDFRSYLKSLVDSYRESPDGLSQYYIPPVTSDDRDLEDIVRQWIVGDSSQADSLKPDQPIAILGAYGIGKSSFAIHLAAGLAEDVLSGHGTRVPILIRLGDVSGEQTLEGLLGKHFTATSQIPGYSFASFRSLNSHGRFLVILDGFDEMKQLLTWREFRYNISQLNRLHMGNSRLIILGRPTAFETDEEHQYVLHGERKSGTAFRREPDWPDYHEVEIRSFNTEQMRAFLRGYLAYRKSDLVNDVSKWEQLWSQVTSKRLKDISRRPVQLRMLAEILPSYSGDVADLDLGTVYELFIDQLISAIIEREEEKHSRLAFSSNERREFLKRFAFWLWDRPPSIVTTDQIPEEVIEPFVEDGDHDAVRRDLVVASPLDRRPGERIRFAHRSFQEFLVAEHLWDLLLSGEVQLPDLDRLLTDEVASFMALQRGTNESLAARSLLYTFRGSLSWRLVNSLLISEDTAQAIHDKIATPRRRRKVRRSKGSTESISPWELLLLATWSTYRPNHFIQLTPSRIVSTVREDQDGLFTLVGLFGLLFMNRAGSEREVLSLLQGLLMRRGNLERVGLEQITSRKGSPKRQTILKPLGRDFVLDMRRGGSQIGRVLGPARLSSNANGTVAITGGKQVDIRWLPNFVLKSALRLQVTKGGRSLELRGLRSIFAQVLPDFAFVLDWCDGEALRSDVELMETVELGADGAVIVDQIKLIGLAVDRLKGEVPYRHITLMSDLYTRSRGGAY